MSSVEVIAPKELTEPLLARWRAIQATDATLDSPGAGDRRRWRLRRAVRGAVVGSGVERLARRLTGRQAAPSED